MTEREMLANALTVSGQPVRSKRIFIGVQRLSVSAIDFREALRDGRVVAIPYRFLGRWELLRATVKQVNETTEGLLALLIPGPNSDLRWPVVPFWVPVSGTAGVLCTW